MISHVLTYYIHFLCLLLDARTWNCIVTRLQRAGRLARQLKLLSFSLRAVVTCCDMLWHIGTCFSYYTYSILFLFPTRWGSLVIRVVSFFLLPSSFSGSLGSLRAPDLSGHMWALPDLNGERQIAVRTGRQPRAPDLCRINATKNARMNAGKTQKVCQIECQNIYIHILLPDGMSETFRNYFRIIVRVGLTRRK